MLKTEFKPKFDYSLAGQVVWGINCLSHDASIAVLRVGSNRFIDAQILFAAHAERYSRVKNDSNLNNELIQAAIRAGGLPARIFYFENPKVKKLRHLKSGDLKNLFAFDSPRSYINSLLRQQPQYNWGRNKRYTPDLPVIDYGDHHRSHAALAYYTNPVLNSDRPGYDTKVDILVIDAIGELDTVTHWRGYRGNLELINKINQYPSSIGLFYSAATQFCGFKPNEEEYILMGAAAFEHPSVNLVAYFEKLIDAGTNFHRGFSEEVRGELLGISPQTIAATVQKVYENYLLKLVNFVVATNAGHSINLAFAGGCALNCTANSRVLLNHAKIKNLWIPPNPGDSGSALGAALAATGTTVNFNTCFLGRYVPASVDENYRILKDLELGKIVGIVSGNAEWGPRALGNRSLLLDPRLVDGQTTMNNIKKRDQFRPFAPVILEEHLKNWFEVPTKAAVTFDYMQYALQCKKPKEIPAVVHVDGSSRVQAVGLGHPLRRLLEQWYNKTGCPVLMLTSMNLKGEPLVNSYADAKLFSSRTGVSVYGLKQ